LGSHVSGSRTNSSVTIGLIFWKPELRPTPSSCAILRFLCAFLDILGNSTYLYLCRDAMSFCEASISFWPASLMCFSGVLRRIQDWIRQSICTVFRYSPVSRSWFMLFNTIIYLRFKLSESRVWLVPSARGVSCRYVWAPPSTYELIRSASSPPFLMWPAARRNIHMNS
jgi:hypothetical protein